MSNTTGQEAVEWPMSKVRETFIKFFEERDHTFVPASPVLPHDDPTLLFCNAGMNQFKSIFLGQVDPSTDFGKLKRAVNSQKCIRAGGKHNDLDDVGKDSYHHTFFEMLGSWSFGDYFKEEAITWAWELLTETYGIEKDRLYVTYFEGHEELGIPADIESKRLWGQFLPSERIIPGNMKDNFWEMGETGPCGSCSEIHYDRIGGRDAAALVNQDDPMVLEIWNLVFMEYNREDLTTFRRLQAQHVDTGMGLERLTSILQGKTANYDIDLFTGLFDAIRETCPEAPQYLCRYGCEDKDFTDTAFRVVADHIRTLTFAIADKCQPANEGRGFVLRRVLRRAVRYGKEKLNAPDNFFAGLARYVDKLMGNHFKELGPAVDEVIETLAYEEALFTKTLESGRREFTKATSALQRGEVIPKETVFLLHDTFGFPVDLTERMAEEIGLRVDEAGFNDMVEEAKKISKEAHKEAKARRTAGLALDLNGDAVKKLNDDKVAFTDDNAKFHVYENNAVVATIKAIYNEKREFVDMLEEDNEAGLVLDVTSFYAEQGGQIHDKGSMKGEHGEFDVVNVQIFGGYVLHIGSTSTGKISVGDKVTLSVDLEWRSPVMNNHTSTHMVNHVLREILGDGVDQKGSLVLPDRFRFDFSYKKAMTGAQMKKVDELMDKVIAADLKVYDKEVPLSLAQSITGVRCMFGEKYPDPVRVVAIGVDVDTMLEDASNEKWKNYSVEFCGGTHIKSSGEVKAFAMLEECSMAAGVRRLMAVTGPEARAAYRNGDSFAAELEELKKIDIMESGDRLNDFKDRIQSTAVPAWRKKLMLDEVNAMEQKIAKHKLALIKEQKKGTEAMVADMVDDFLAGKVESEFIVHKMDEVAPKVLKDAQKKLNNALVEGLKKIDAAGMSASFLFILPNANGKQIAVMTVCSKAAVAKGLKANEWAVSVANVMGGKGGGKPDKAQASGKDYEKIPQAQAKAKEIATKTLSS